MEELQARHRKELKDLQGKITSKKKNATKKTRKGVNDECAALEAGTRARHAAEVAALQGDSPDEAAVEQTDADAAAEASGDAPGAAPELASKTEALALDDAHDAGDQGQGGETADAPGKKKNRQKARLARRAAEQEAMAAQAAQEAASMPDLRKQERQRFLEEFDRRGLEEKAVAANGHCLYSAMADQIHQLGLQVDAFDLDAAQATADDAGEQERGQEPARDAYKLVRGAAAAYISSHSDDFVPFLEEPLDEYVHKVKDTGEWGGQLELLALAKTYRMDIHVLQGDGRVEKIEGGAPADQHPAWLAYYRHGFGLGEHYNSLRRAQKQPKV